MRHRQRARSRCSTRCMNVARPRTAMRHGDGVADGLRRRAAVADDAQPGDAEQRRAAVLRVVDALAEPPERAPRQQVADLARKRALQLLAEQRPRPSRPALRSLQHDVAGEAVADDHVGVAAVDLARLDVADEVQRRGLEQLVRLARQLVALASLPRRSTAARPAAARRRARPARRPRPSRANCSRCCGRHSTLAPASSSTAEPPPRRDRRRQRRPIDARQHAERRVRRHARVAPVCPALTSAAASPLRHQLGGHANRRARLAPQRRGRRLAPCRSTSGASTMRTSRSSAVGMSRELGADRLAPARPGRCRDSR